MFFQNVFNRQFQGNWVLGDRNFSIPFKCQNNNGRGDEIVTAWNVGPYNLSINDTNGNARNTLVITCALDQNNFQNWFQISVNVTTGAVSSSAVTGLEIANALNADTVFPTYFYATPTTVNYQNPISYENNGATGGVNYSVNSSPSNTVSRMSQQTFPDNSPRICIQPKLSTSRFWFYINNGQAEEAIGFNKRSGVSEMPTYFARHTMANRFNFTDSQNLLIPLSSPITAISAAGPPVITSANHGLTTGNKVWITGTDSVPLLDAQSGGSGTITFTGTLASTATTATLNASWTGNTGYYTVTFSDGEQRTALFTNSSATISWTTGLSNGVTASATVLKASLYTVTVVDTNTFSVALVSGSISTAGTKGFWSTPVNYNLINNAVDAKGTSLGLAFGSSNADYKLLAGRSGIFNTQTITLDAQRRILQIIEYPSGASVGNLGRKINYTWAQTGDTNPTQILEVPYTLTTADIV